jgi:hypothetical protein
MEQSVRDLSIFPSVEIMPSLPLNFTASKSVRTSIRVSTLAISLSGYNQLVFYCSLLKIDANLTDAPLCQYTYLCLSGVQYNSAAGQLSLRDG